MQVIYKASFTCVYLREQTVDGWQTKGAGQHERHAEEEEIVII